MGSEENNFLGPAIYLSKLGERILVGAPGQHSRDGGMDGMGFTGL